MEELLEVLRDIRRCERELCQVDGIRRVVDDPEIRGRVDYREAESDHFCYFLKPAPLRVVADQIGRLAIPRT